MATSTYPMTLKEMECLPDDGKRRELIRGSLREKERVLHDRRHGTAAAALGAALSNWLDSQPPPRGEVVSGEAPFHLESDPDTAVGIAVAYVSAEVAARDPEAVYFEGPPVLAVEVLSPSDKQEEIDEKIELYLECGVEIVWIVNPRLRSVTAYRPDSAPAIFAPGQELEGGPELPGFRLAVANLF